MLFLKLIFCLDFIRVICFLNLFLILQLFSCNLFLYSSCERFLTHRVANAENYILMSIHIRVYPIYIGYNKSINVTGTLIHYSTAARISRRRSGFGRMKHSYRLPTCAQTS